MPSGIPATILVVLVSTSGATATANAQPPAVSCIASGYDVIIVNGTDREIGTETEIEWRVPFTRTSGTHSLHEPLEPGARVILSGALGSDFLAGESPCEVVTSPHEVNG